MVELGMSAALAFWLGIQTSISPCPMTMNIAAVSYLARRLGRPRLVLLSGLLFAFGQVVAYVIVAFSILAFALSVARVSLALPGYVYPATGPVLIVAGMAVLGLFSFVPTGGGLSERMQRRVDALGVWGAFLLGALFALSFCPTSAAWFFGSLIPLCLRWKSVLILPACYGLGTALPVLVFAILIAKGAASVGRAFAMLTTVERLGRTVGGVALIGLGIFLSLRHIFRLI